MTTAPSPEPQLDAPGRGLPFFEGLYARFIMYPRMMRAYDGRQVMDTFTRETAKIIELARGLDEEAFFTRVLIDRLPGLEDSSRYWSAAMVLEHLIICMRPMTQISETLAQGHAMNIRISTADVKPRGGRKLTRQQWLDNFTAAAAETAGRIEALATLPQVAKPAGDAPRVWHPFFGGIPARGWLWVLGAHQITHRRQMQRIITGLKA